MTEERPRTSDAVAASRTPSSALAVYVHVPFCAARCDYCAFYSVAGSSADLRGRYLERVRGERAALDQPPTSIYVGGGTPSVLEPDELADLLGMLGTAPEFTVEANPDSLMPEKIDILARCGVNRVSLGIQSFLPAHRRTIGRRGTLAGLADTLSRLRAAGILNIGMDLICCIPGQTLDDWRVDLTRAADCGVRHVSTYELTAEEGTRLAAARLPAASEETSVEMWRLAAELLRPFGLERYEVSNLSQPGSECAHNMDIWHGGAYLGFGPAAASFDGGDRWTNPADIGAWLDGRPPDRDHLPPARRAAEILALGLRTTAGWTRPQFRAATGTDIIESYGDILAELAGHGLLELTDDAVRPTERGLLLADAVARRLL
jgi:oxygen-independent coproporphyrinogen III oxidase